MSEPKESYNEEMMQIVIDSNCRSLKKEQIEDANVKIMNGGKRRGLLYKMIGGLLFVGIAGIGLFYVSNQQANGIKDVIMNDQQQQTFAIANDGIMNETNGTTRQLSSQRLSSQQQEIYLSVINTKLQQLAEKKAKFTVVQTFGANWWYFKILEEGGQFEWRFLASKEEKWRRNWMNFQETCMESNLVSMTMTFVRKELRTTDFEYYLFTRNIQERIEKETGVTAEEVKTMTIEMDIINQKMKIQVNEIEKQLELPLGDVDYEKLKKIVPKAGFICTAQEHDYDFSV